MSLYPGPSKQILILGSSGFIGRHLMVSPSGQIPLQLVAFTRPPHFDLLNRASRQIFSQTVNCRDVLILSWATTTGPQFDRGLSHHQWALSIIDLVNELDAVGVKCWIAGAGTDFETTEPMSAYAEAKRLMLSMFEAKWSSRHCYVSLPYIYSAFHQRPRVVLDAVRNSYGSAKQILRNPDAEHDYLDVRDVASQLLCELAQGGTGIRRITSGSRTSNAKLVSFVRGLSDEAVSSCSCVSPASSNDLQPLKFTQTLLELG